MENLYQEIVKLRAICLSNHSFLESMYTKVHSSDFEDQPEFIMNGKLANIPMKTLHEVQEFELQLGNDDVKNYLAHFLKSLGGRDGRDHLFRGLGQLFTNALATQCSWYGQRGNYKIKDLQSIKILTEIINRNYSELTYSEIAKHARDWFRLSRTRLNREIKKNTAESQ